jgi:hypothetical protein
MSDRAPSFSRLSPAGSSSRSIRVLSPDAVCRVLERVPPMEPRTAASPLAKTPTFGSPTG